jgi:hypothetical protein
VYGAPLPPAPAIVNPPFDPPKQLVLVVLTIAAVGLPLFNTL